MNLIKKVLVVFEKSIDFFSPAPTTYNVSDFSFVEELRANKEIIIKEYENVKMFKFHDISPETAPDKYFKNSNWNVFFLFSYDNVFTCNTSKCPVTYSILKKYKNIKTALFSMLPPNSYMEPHRGPYKGVLRCLFKLKLDDTSNSVGIKIKNETFDWRLHDCIIFDDTYEHSAWNYTKDNRVVLFLDVERPLLFPLNLINKIILFFINKNKRFKKIYNFYKQQNNYKDL